MSAKTKAEPILGKIVAVFCGVTVIRGEEVAMFAAERLKEEDDCTSYIPMRVDLKTARLLRGLQDKVALLNEV